MPSRTKKRLRILGAGLAGLLLAAGPAAASHVASFSKTDQKCRSQIAKVFTKAVGSASKVSNSCHKSRNADKILPTVDCNDLAQADTKGKFQKAQDKLTGAIATLCTSAGASAVLLEEYISCPEPCGTETGVSNPLASFTELGQCLACLAGDVVERRNADVLGMPAQPMDSAEQNCHAAIAKGYGKRLSAQLKTRTGCQKQEDAAANTTLQPCDTADPKGKIAKATTKAESGVASACASVDLNAMDSCATTNVMDLQACVEAEDDAAGAEAFVAAYELDPTICPASLSVVTHAGFGVGGASATRLDSGWNGIGHGQDLVDLYSYGIGLSCPNSEPPCGSCTVTGFTDTGVQSGAFTRCREDTSIECSPAFGIDADCPGSQECAFYLGPPLPLSASNTPVCVVPRAAADVTGTVVVETGDSVLDLTLRAVVHTGIGLTQPCPECVGDTTAQDGLAQGTCDGGARDGELCDTQGFDATFGEMSLDCPPHTAQNISGQGLLIEAPFATSLQSMPFGTQCDFPLAAMACACAVCTLDTTLPCNSNADCAAVLAGNCTSNGGGQPRAPNACSDLTCTDVGGNQGECDAGPDVTYCDGQLRANGNGFLSCNTNADCLTVNSACDDNDCGDCTIVEPRSCFLDPIVGVGSADPETPLLASTFCIPPTTSSGVNAATGQPGPSRALVQLETVQNY